MKSNKNGTRAYRQDSAYGVSAEIR